MDAQATRLKTTAQIWVGGQEFESREFDLPELTGSQAIAQIDLATVCGSDAHTVTGRRTGACPSILGHEAVGTLVAIGPNGARDALGRDLSIGDRVIWSVTVSCGACDRCLAGRSAKCRTLLKTGHEALDGPWGISGGYASHIHLPEGITLVAVPDELSDAAAAPAACATATVMAVLEAAGDVSGQRVLVSGAGMLGLVACAAARQRGAASVVASDINPERLELARAFGATDTLQSPGKPQPSSFDVAVDLSGAQPALAAALDALDVGGRLVVAGSVSPGPALCVDPERVVRFLLGITGVHNYEPRHLQQAIAFLMATRDLYDWDSLVAAPRPARELAHLMAPPQGRILRNSITFNSN